MIIKCQFQKGNIGVEDIQHSKNVCYSNLNDKNAKLPHQKKKLMKYNKEYNEVFGFIVWRRPDQSEIWEGRQRSTSPNGQMVGDVPWPHDVLLQNSSVQLQLRWTK